MQRNLQKELVRSFFGGYYYLTFENLEEVKTFLEYISNFDDRFKNFEKIEKIKSVMWHFSPDLHKYQLEWMDTKEFFGKRFFIDELQFNEISDYVEWELLMYNLDNKTGFFGS